MSQSTSILQDRIHRLESIIGTPTTPLSSTLTSTTLSISNIASQNPSIGSLLTFNSLGLQSLDKQLIPLDVKKRDLVLNAQSDLILYHDQVCFETFNDS
jgi:hypothetical protein